MGMGEWELKTQMKSLIFRRRREDGWKQSKVEPWDGAGVIVNWMVNMEVASGVRLNINLRILCIFSIDSFSCLYTQGIKSTHTYLSMSIDSALEILPRNSDVSVALLWWIPLSEIWRNGEKCFPSGISREPFATFISRLCVIICGLQSAHCFSWSHFSPYTSLPSQPIVCCCSPLVYAFMVHLFRLSWGHLWTTFSQPRQWILQG